MHECRHEDKIDTMSADIKEIKADVRALLETKWKSEGAKDANKISWKQWGIIGAIAAGFNWLVPIISGLVK